jgi:Uma2 family endonuclease
MGVARCTLILKIMTFQIDDVYLPATLTIGPMTDEAFAALCKEHPDLNFELSAHGELIVMPPTFTLTGARNNEISGQLWRWARQDHRGVAFDSSTGWKLPNGARRSPDAAWVLKERIKTLGPESFGGFWHICPDFVIELRSESDKLRILRDKMAEWLANGAQLGWLIDPETRTVEIYRPGYEPEAHVAISRLSGEGPVKGFVLDLAPVWDPLG